MLMRRFSLFWIGILLFVLPQVAAQDDTPAPVAVATEYIDLALAGDFEAAAELHDATMTSVFAPPVFAATWAQIFGASGEFVSRNLMGQEAAQGYQVIVFDVRFENGNFAVTVPIDAESKVAGLNAVPITLPNYADLTAFEETDVTINEDGGWPLPGSLTLPVSDDPVPAVVFLPGSGPTDRDGTIGLVNKPLRDLAYGLASNGIATLRFDKRSKVHGERLLDELDFTLDDEYTFDAQAAVALLRQNPAVDPDQIYILGHSLGAHGAIRAAAAEPEQVAGLILMAGSPVSLDALSIRQFEYLRGLEINAGQDAQARIVDMLALLEQILAIDEDSPDDQLYMGAYAAYWLDLRANPAGPQAASLTQPMLILQGERDYQVTVEEGIDAWRDVLSEKENVIYTGYPNLNHLFMVGNPGEGLSTPTDYSIPGHVPESVIADIVSWIADQAVRSAALAQTPAADQKSLVQSV